MVVQTIQNFNKEDCVHFKWTIARGCCGRSVKAGICTVPDSDGHKRHKVCSTKQNYCKYEKREDN